MIHDENLFIIKSKKSLNEEFVFPNYEKYCISNIAKSIINFFDFKEQNENNFLFIRDENENKILFLLIDGQGYNQFLESSKYVNFYNLLLNKADVMPITSVFPSTTPAALTSIHTGLTPQEHGLPEWTVYFEETDKIIETLPFRPIFNPHREALLDMGGYPQMLYEGNTVYLSLKNKGYKSFVFVDENYSNSAYSRMTQNGAEVVPYSDYPDLFLKIIDKLVNYKEPAYYFVYLPHIDSIQHSFGINSHEHFVSLGKLSRIIKEEFLDKLNKDFSSTVKFVMTSDHGQTNIKGEDIIYLNDYLNLESSYLWGKSKIAIRPTGSPHDIFLHIYDPKIKEILDFLRNELKGKADVLLIDEAIDLKLFGINKPIDKFINRIGDILILPHKGYHIWYKHLPDFNWKQKGIHGGLSEEEMLVPFISCNLKDLL